MKAILSVFAKDAKGIFICRIIFAFFIAVTFVMSVPPPSIFIFYILMQKGRLKSCELVMRNSGNLFKETR